AAFKFARKWSGKTEIVAFSGSFHGRLFATLAATDRPEYRKPFEPLVPGVRIVPREDWAAVDHAVSASRTAAVIVEPVQGEGGVRPIAEPDFLTGVRQKGEWLAARLASLAARSPRVREIRGRGLMWGLELAEPAAPFVTAARARGLLVLTAGANVLRLVPPLVITPHDLERGVAILEEVLA